jgi:hypothetical protein
MFALWGTLHYAGRISRRTEKRVFEVFSLIRAWDTREYYMKERWIELNGFVFTQAKVQEDGLYLVNTS